MTSYSTDDFARAFYQKLADGQPGGATDTDVRALLNALREAREQANYFADILAASAERALSVKSTSKSERSRQLHVCTTVQHMLVTESGHWASREKDHVVERLAGIVKEYTPKKEE